jgi:hypothetical protein
MAEKRSAGIGEGRGSKQQGPKVSVEETGMHLSVQVLT